MRQLFKGIAVSKSEMDVICSTYHTRSVVIAQTAVLNVRAATAFVNTSLKRANDLSKLGGSPSKLT